MNRVPPRRRPDKRPRGRRALEQIGGPIRTAGDPEAAAALEDALRRAETVDGDALTHGFHVYPARMHRGIAQAVLELLGGARTVHDPFCGSGTTLVEARLADRKPTGSDLSPLAVRLATLKTWPRTSAQRERLHGLAQAAAEASHQRVKSKTRVRAPLPPKMIELYQGHVLLELAGLLVEIRAHSKGADRDALELVFSAMVGKFSRQRGATDARQVDKRVGRHVPTKFFMKKTEELLERWADYERALPEDAPRADVWMADILDENKRRDPAALVLTSPPYGGTYDYRSHHHLRCRWLGIDDRHVEEAELGARRRLSEPKHAARRWDQEVAGMLGALAACCEPSGQVVMLMGDGLVGKQPVAVDEQLRRLAPAAGLEIVAVASQQRTDWRGGPAREEHLALLTRR
jgi:hypothetical protein